MLVHERQAVFAARDLGWVVGSVPGRTLTRFNPKVELVVHGYFMQLVYLPSLQTYYAKLYVLPDDLYYD